MKSENLVWFIEEFMRDVCIKDEAKKIIGKEKNENMIDIHIYKYVDLLDNDCCIFKEIKGDIVIFYFCKVMPLDNSQFIAIKNKDGCIIQFTNFSYNYATKRGRWSIKENSVLNTIQHLNLRNSPNKDLGEILRGERKQKI